MASISPDGVDGVPFDPPARVGIPRLIYVTGASIAEVTDDLSLLESDLRASQNVVAARHIGIVEVPTGQTIHYGWVLYA